MELTPAQLGMEQLRKIDGDGGEAVLASLEHIAPDVGRYILEFAFGEIYSRPGLTLPEREMVTLASLLTAGGCEPQLAVHISGGLNVGLTPEQITEVLIQCIPYVGFPRVLNAISQAKQVFAQRNAPRD